MSIVLIRHGETLLNASRTIQPAATPLAPRGRAQARAVAERLARSNPAALVSSDLPRAVETAEAIAAACGLSIAYEPLLQERNFGDLRGRPLASLGFDPLTMTEAPPGGESTEAFRDRVARAFARIVALRAGLDGDLVVVTHGLVIAAILDGHATLAAGATRPGRLSNTAVSILEARSPHRVGLLDCSRHLDAAAAEDPRSLAGG